MKRVADTSVRARVIIILAKSLGVILSLVLLVAVIFLLTKRNDSSVKTIRFAIAKQDITGQQILSQDNVTMQEFDVNYAPHNGVSEEQIKQLIGKKIFYTVRRGDIISPSLFGATKDDLTGGIANAIPKDKKLVYIKLDDVHTFPPDLQKDSVIDIIAVNQKSETNNTEVVAEKISVLDVVHSKENGIESITQIGLVASDTQVMRLSSKFTADWKLNLALHSKYSADDETSSLLQTASDESKLIVTPTEYDKAKAQ